MRTHTAPSHVLPRLPYDDTALAPVISANQLGHHHGRHHRGYIDTLNKLVKGTDLAGMGLSDLIRATKGQAERVGIYQSAAQAWNHSFYWASLTPGGGGLPPMAIRQLMDTSFGSAEACNEALSAAATARFGSGWVWLVKEGDALSVVHTANADMPEPQICTPLLVIDVWEHAYYLDYQEKRAAHVAAVLDKLINWGSANDKLG